MACTQVDIFSKDVILIPVNHSNAHWSAAVINFAAKRIESYDSLDLKNSRKGMLFQQLRSYIREEYRDKKGGDFDFTGWIDYGRPVRRC
jgi:sentrin-specific protease 1